MKASCGLPFATKPVFAKLNKKDDLLDHALIDPEEERPPPLQPPVPPPILVPYEQRLFNWVASSSKGDLAASSPRATPHVQWGIGVPVYK